ncbi:hypothetical protein [Saccharibacillus qingshengii]|uniref:hypothetical protein n=1 Tax=Saccharibacillus qingshengii TaxID=1763540 RepID=UPI0015554BA0|nr:hypothetical protein [Saccharibacillus qingshengii]
MKTHYALGLILLFVLAFVLAEYPFTRQIDKAIPAVLSNADLPNSDKRTVIRVQGEVSRKLFRRPEFKVNVTVDGFDWMTDGRHSGEVLRTERNKGINMGILQHTYSPKYAASNGFDWIKTATIWFDDDFGQVYIMASTASWMDDPVKEAGTLRMTGAADNPDEAWEIQRQIGEAYPGWFEVESDQVSAALPMPGLSP